MGNGFFFQIAELKTNHILKLTSNFLEIRQNVTAPQTAFVLPTEQGDI